MAKMPKKYSEWNNDAPGQCEPHFQREREDTDDRALCAHQMLWGQVIKHQIGNALLNRAQQKKKKRSGTPEIAQRFLLLTLARHLQGHANNNEMHLAE